MPKIFLPKPKPNRKKDENIKQRQKIYQSRRWQKLRIVKLMEHPLCEICEKELATEVHHIQSFMGHPKEEMLRLAYNYNNLQSLCDTCHNKIHNSSKQ
jgi:5-methylcytosine-specific restriction protein A